ncbi:MAG: chromate transporter [Oscillospiraceae bacterium]|nr:chromate transporter [Oscillospiraceae bacterium]
MLTILQLYWSFCKIGFTSFGGLSMIPLISSEMLSHGWMSASEVSDIVALAEMTPGPLGLNCATFAGIRVTGLLGALAANFGILTPTFTICAVAALFFERFKQSDILKGIMIGVRPVCIGLIWAVILNLGVSNYFADWTPQWGSMLVAVVGAYLLIRRKWSVPAVIVLAAVLGILVC